MGSGVAVVVWSGAALIVLGRAGYLARDRASTVFRTGTWILAAVSALGALMNFASQSHWENFIFGPLTLTETVLCIVVACSPTNRKADSPQDVVLAETAGVLAPDAAPEPPVSDRLDPARTADAAR